MDEQDVVLLGEDLGPTKPLVVPEGHKVVRTYFFIEGMWHIISTVAPNDLCN